MLAHLSHCFSLLQARSGVACSFFGAPWVSQLLMIVSVFALQCYQLFHREKTVPVFAFTFAQKLAFAFKC